MDMWKDLSSQPAAVPPGATVPSFLVEDLVTPESGHDFTDARLFLLNDDISPGFCSQSPISEKAIACGAVPPLPGSPQAKLLKGFLRHSSTPNLHQPKTKTSLKRSASVDAVHARSSSINSFAAHAFILAARSPVLAALIVSCFKKLLR
jgi:hypothetical protein